MLIFLIALVSHLTAHDNFTLNLSQGREIQPENQSQLSDTSQDDFIEFQFGLIFDFANGYIIYNNDKIYPIYDRCEDESYHCILTGAFSFLAPRSCKLLTVGNNFKTEHYEFEVIAEAKGVTAITSGHHTPPSERVFFLGHENQPHFVLAYSAIKQDVAYIMWDPNEEIEFTQIARNGGMSVFLQENSGYKFRNTGTLAPCE